MHTRGMEIADGEIPDVKPVKPPFFGDLFHKGIGIWWVMVVAGAIVLAVSAYLYFSGRMKVNASVPTVSALVVAFGVFFIYMSY